jgi:hypothetical protein
MSVILVSFLDKLNFKLVVTNPDDESLREDEGPIA